MKKTVKYSFLGLLMASILLVGITVCASAQTVSETQAAIKAKGGNWVAGDNPMSRLTLDQKRNTLGLLLSPASELPPPASHPSTVGLPSSIDWRNNGGNYVSDIKSQGMCNSCWAFSTTAAVESAIMIANKTPNANLDLMEAVLISCCTNCSARACASGYLGPAAAYMVSHGEPLQTCPATDCNYTCPNDTIKSYESVAQDVNSMKAAIANYGPIVAGMHVYNDFYHYTGGVYSYTGAGYVGDHAIALIGYTDAGQYFIGKNSWGTGWGEAGFFRIAYSEVGGTSALGMQSVAYHGGDPTPPPPPPPPTCTYPIGDLFAASGGAGNIQVATSAGCAWSATSNAAWITFPSGGNGSGPGTLTYSVAPNTTSSRRTGTMTVPGGTYTVVQELGSAQCAYSISSSNNSFTAAGGNGSVSVTANSGCSWTAASGVSWLTVTGGASGSGNGTVTFSVAANGTASIRSGNLTIAGQALTVTQSAMSCTYSISPSSNSFSAAAGTGTVTVTAPTGCAWTAASNTTSFLSVTSGASGSGNGTVNYAVAANTTTSQRNGTLTVAGQTFTATQSAMSCTYSISPSSNSFSAAAGTGTVTVTAPTGCAWTAASNTTSFLSVTSGASGSGNGTVNYSVAANTTTSQRNGTLTVAGQTFTATQSAMSCTYSISPSSNSFSAAAGTGTVTVTAPTGCAWTAASNTTSFLSVTSGASGLGNGTVTYSVTANSATASRTGTLTIAGQTFTAIQAGVSTCGVQLSAGGFNFGYLSRQGSFQVTAASTCSWNASASAPWITFNSGATGKGNGTVIFTIDTNTGSTRTGTIGVNNASLIVNQSGSATCTYVLSATSQSVAAAGGTGTVTVSAGSACAWTAASNASWITVTGSGTGNGSVTYTVQANTGSSRTGTLTIAGQTFTATQAGAATCSYTLNPTNQNFSTTGGTGTFNVTAASTCSWTATSNVSWLTINPGVRASGNGSVSYSVVANTGASRTGTISIADKTFTVTQDGTAPTCSVRLNVWGLNFPYSYMPRTATVQVTADSTCSWSASSNVPWMSFPSGATGKGNGSLSFIIDVNNGASRTGTVTINGSTVTVNEGGRP